MSETVEKPAEAPPVETVSIEIDGVEMQVPKGSMIIEAADKVGITIPRFCYHSKLSIAANCRMCLVDVEKAPKPLPACATPVMDGMKVYTQSKRAVSSQQNVMEFLLINHPLDCPICDQGGECELQDVSMGFGRSVSRFTERKRVVKDENLGSLVSTDMTRCIHCTRCVRFLEEIAGTNELGGMGRGDRTFISTFIGRSVDSELSGNIIDLCPVGALTNKPYRYRARAWELRAKSAIASHDAIGSNQILHTRRGRILRSVPDDNEAINENWLSDRDRWGIEGLNTDDRATQPMVKQDGEWQQTDWNTAIDATAEALRSVEGDQLGVLLSPRASNEELYLAQRIARGLGSGNIDHRLRQRDFEDQGAMAMQPAFEMAIADISSADAILLVGSNVRHDAPILGHRVRQAWRAGARIMAINPIAWDFHFDLAVSAVRAPDAMVDTLAAVASAAGASGEGALGPLLGGAGDDPDAATIAETLKAADRPMILLGDGAVAHDYASALRALAGTIAKATGAKLNQMPMGANGAGAWLVGAVPHRELGGKAAEVSGRHVRQMLDEPRKVVVVYDFEPQLDCADGSLWSDALAQADAVIYAGAYVNDAIRDMADIILPLATLPEAEGSLTNVDGSIQVNAGTGHSPGESRSGWKVLRALGNTLGLAGFEFTRIQQVREAIQAGMTAGTDAESGLEPETPAVPKAGSGLALYVDLPMYAVDGVVRRSAPLQRTVHAASGCVRVNPADAESLTGAESALVTAGDSSAIIPVQVDPQVAPGCAVLSAGVAEAAGLIHASRIEVAPA